MLTLGLLACSPDPDTTIDPAPAADSETREKEPLASQPALLARWQSFSYNPPRYAVETLNIYNDFSCSISDGESEEPTPCRWERTENDQLTLSFPGRSETLIASLRPAKSIGGKAEPGIAGYLLIQFTDTKRQIFVLDGSEDAQMVRDTINGESLWSAGQRQQGVEKLHRALQQGSSYARLRLGWLYASDSNFLQPDLALKLLLPLRNNRSYPVQNALAVAYAAQGDYPSAVTHAELACTLGDANQQRDCQQRLASYRAN